MYRLLTSIRIMMLAIILSVAGCATDRIDPPPQGEVSHLPWGAVDIEALDARREDVYSDEAIQSFGAYAKQYKKQYPGKKIPYRMLALSGGGSRGAYGAGVLSGWTQSGTRPQFDVVTGVSTGALIATPAFLGSKYDSSLALFTKISNEDIFRPNGKLAILNSEGLNDTTPLKELLAKEIDESMIDDVALEYQNGRALFIGTTNLDAKLFTIWDMGRIAASDTPEKYQLYRDIVMASASFPIVFPPVYLPVTTAKGDTYYQMHTDGGIKETAFIYDYLGEFREKLSNLGLDWDKDIDAQIFLLNNGKLHEDGKYRVVNPDTLSIAMRSMFTLMRSSAASSIYVIWTMGLAHGATVNLSFIPDDYDLSLGSLDFDREKMTQLFEYGYKQSIRRNAWVSRKPPKNIQDFRKLLEFYSQLNPVNPSLRIDPSQIGLEPINE